MTNTFLLVFYVIGITSFYGFQTYFTSTIISAPKLYLWLINASAFSNSAGKSFRRIAPTDCTKVSKRSFMHRHFSLKLRFHVEPSRFSCWTVKIFMLNGPDFHDDRSRFSRWTVEIFILNDWDIHVERSRFSCWTALIFIMNGRDFHDKRSWYLGWTVRIFTMTVDDRSRFLLWQMKNCFTALASITEREGSIWPSSFLLLSICQPYLLSRWVLLFVAEIAEQNKDAGWI